MEDRKQFSLKEFSRIYQVYLKLDSKMDGSHVFTATTQVDTPRDLVHLKQVKECVENIITMKIKRSPSLS